MNETMKAVGYMHALPVDDPDYLLDIELPRPEPGDRDLLVAISAIAVNPVDCKVRRRVTPEPGQFQVLGWDAVGTVVATGAAVTRFSAGDTVYYAGDLNRPGCNAQFQLVDERLAGHKPGNLSDAEAAALPLTSITAWELLFDHLQLRRQQPGAIERTDEVALVVGAAGGVGSILLQLVRSLTGATIIATASRAQSRDWVMQLGADHVVDHAQPLAPQLQALMERSEIGAVTHVASLTHTDQYFQEYTEILAPFGRIAMIDDPASPLDVMQLKRKSLSLHIEFMFARSLFGTPDMSVQGEILDEVARLAGNGLVRTTLGRLLGTVDATHLRAAHEELASGRAIGKLVLAGFAP